MTNKKEAGKSIKHYFARLPPALKLRGIHLNLKSTGEDGPPERIKDRKSITKYFDRQFDSNLEDIRKGAQPRNIKGTGKSIISYFDRLPTASEFRSIYFNLRNIWQDGGPRSILVSSSSLGEGKSTIASLLAVALSSYGERMTVLIDADLRRPAIHKLFDLPQSPGLAELLLGEAGTAEVLNSTPLNNLKIITSGRQIEKVSKALKTDILKDLLQKLKLNYGYVIIDTAPIIPVPDSLILSRHVDGVILVLKAGSTPREVAKRAYDLLKDARGDSLGIILNNMKKALPYYYNYGYYGYGSSKKEKR